MVFLFHLSFFLFFLSFLEFLTSNNEEIPLWKRGQELLDSSYSSLCVWNLLVTAVESRFLAFKNDCDTKYLTPKVMDAAVVQVSMPVWNSRHYDSAPVHVKEGRYRFYSNNRVTPFFLSYVSPPWLQLLGRAKRHWVEEWIS